MNNRFRDRPRRGAVELLVDRVALCGLRLVGQTTGVMRW
jgi:hypothetical protein